MEYALILFFILVGTVGLLTLAMPQTKEEDDPESSEQDRAKQTESAIIDKLPTKLPLTSSSPVPSPETVTPLAVKPAQARKEQKSTLETTRNTAEDDFEEQAQLDLTEFRT